MVKRWAAVGGAAALLLPGIAAAAPPPQAAFVPGAVVALRGTTHLWIEGDDGSLHWAGDSRALATRFVSWGTRYEFSADQIKTFRRGDPWLSAGLVKMGDPIYLVKWEADQPSPTLLHIQSIADVELFGISGDNYGGLVLDQGPWESRYGMGTAGLRRAELEAAVPGGLPAATPAATPTPAAPSASPTPAAPATSASRLNRQPLLGPGGDLTFVPPSGWKQGLDLGARDPRDVHLELMYSSSVIGTWTITDGVYLQVAATALDYNPDVHQVADLARRVFAVYCKNTESCKGTDASTAMTVGGKPALAYDTRVQFKYVLGDPNDEGAPRVEREWVAHHVFVVYGNWGYELRVFSENPAGFLDWAHQVDRVLQTAQFTY